MMPENKRYSCVRDPADAWMVWDESEDRPAEWPMLLIGLSEIDARVYCDVLNVTNWSRPDLAA